MSLHPIPDYCRDLLKLSLEQLIAEGLKRAASRADSVVVMFAAWIGSFKSSDAAKLNAMNQT